MLNNPSSIVLGQNQGSIAHLNSNNRLKNTSNTLRSGRTNQTALKLQGHPELTIKTHHPYAHLGANTNSTAMFSATASGIDAITTYEREQQSIFDAIETNKKRIQRQIRESMVKDPLGILPKTVTNKMHKKRLMSAAPECFDKRRPDSTYRAKKKFIQQQIVMNAYDMTSSDLHQPHINSDCGDNSMRMKQRPMTSHPASTRNFDRSQKAFHIRKSTNTRLKSATRKYCTINNVLTKHSRTHIRTQLGGSGNHTLKSFAPQTNKSSLSRSSSVASNRQEPMVGQGLTFQIKKTGVEEDIGQSSLMKKRQGNQSQTIQPKVRIDTKSEDSDNSQQMAKPRSLSKRKVTEGKISIKNLIEQRRKSPNQDLMYKSSGSKKTDSPMRKSLKSSGSKFKNLQGLSRATLNQYQSQLQGMAPGRMIDELKDAITAKKKENQDIIAGINEVNDEINKTKELRNEQLRKADRGQRDKQELYRDMSTYECNFVRRDDNKLLNKLNQITDRINNTSSQLEKGKKNSWIDIEQTDELLEQLEKLQQVKRCEHDRKMRMSSKYSLVQFDENDYKRKEAMNKFGGAIGSQFQKKKPGSNSRTPKNYDDQEESLENMSMAFQKLSDILRNKEECNEMREVAGQMCWVKAAYINGNVFGKISCVRSSKSYDFDFKPLTWRKGFLLLAELQRLYFQYEEQKTATGKKKGVFLKVKPEKDCPTDKFNLDDSELIYLAKIMGCRDPFVKMVLTNQRVTNDQTVHVKVHMQDQVLEIDVQKSQYDFLKAPALMTWRQDVKLATIAKQLEKELVIVEKTPGSFSLEWLTCYSKLKTNESVDYVGTQINIEPETPVSELLKEIKERRRQVRLDLEKVKKVQESDEESKSKREQLDQEQQLVSPDEKKKLGSTRQSMELDSSGRRKLDNEQPVKATKLDQRRPSIRVLTQNIKVSGLNTHRVEASAELQKYDFLYQVRNENPNSYKKDDYLRDISDRMRKDSLKYSKNWINIDFTDFYTRTKRQFTKKHMAGIETSQELTCKRVQINDIMEKLQIENRADQEKTIKLIFVQKQDESAPIECYVGMENQASPTLLRSRSSISSISKVSDDSTGGQVQYTIFNTMINIEQKLLEFLAEDGLQSVKDVMANTDKFSKNTAFLRIVWKEANNLAGGSDSRTSPAKKVKQQTKRKATRLRVDVNASQGRLSEATPLGAGKISNSSSPLPLSHASPSPAVSPSGRKNLTLPKYGEEEQHQKAFNLMTTLMPMTPVQNKREPLSAANVHFGKHGGSDLQIAEEINESDGEQSKM